DAHLFSATRFGCFYRFEAIGRQAQLAIAPAGADAERERFAGDHEITRGCDVLRHDHDFEVAGGIGHRGEAELTAAVRRAVFHRAHNAGHRVAALRFGVLFGQNVRDRDGLARADAGEEFRERVAGEIEADAFAFVVQTLLLRPRLRFWQQRTNAGF